MSRLRRKSFSALLAVAAAAGLVAGGATAPVATAATETAQASVGKVVGYFTEWGVYDRNYHVKNIETSGSASKLTHINYAFGNVTNGGCAIGDAYADYQKTYDAAAASTASPTPGTSPSPAASTSSRSSRPSTRASRSCCRWAAGRCRPGSPTSR